MREVRSFPVICKYGSKKTRKFLSDSFYFLCKRVYDLLRVMVYHQIASAEYQTILNLWD